MTPIQATSTTTPTSGTSTSGTSSATASNNLDQSAFLQLLVAELKNQDPTQPMNGKDMIAQLAQLNQTQYSGQMLTMQQETFASSVIGKTVTGSVAGKRVTGIVSDFAINGSTVNLTVAGQPMNVTSVSSVMPADATPPAAATTTTTTTATQGGTA